MLRTWDLPGSVAFYTNVLGFKCDRLIVSVRNGVGLGIYDNNGYLLQFGQPVG